MLAGLTCNSTYFFKNMEVFQVYICINDCKFYFLFKNSQNITLLSSTIPLFLLAFFKKGLAHLFSISIMEFSKISFVARSTFQFLGFQNSQGSIHG